jgi:hypothetical protein
LEEEKTYEEFIQNILDTRGRFNCGDEYHERHHILPKCMGGHNEKENLIDLYAREHFEAHRLLALQNPENESLVYAWHMMSTKKDNDQKQYNITADEYEEAKIAFSKINSGENHPNFGKHHTEEEKYNLSKRMSGKNNPMYGVHRYGTDSPMYGKFHTKEAKQKMSDAQKERFENPENHPRYGRHLTQETKYKISVSVKEAMRNEEVLEKLRKPRPSIQGENNPNYGKSPQERMDEGAYQRWLENLRANILRGENHPLYGIHRESPMLGKHHTEEAKEKMRGPRPSVQGENNPNYGHIYSEEEIIELRKLHEKEMKCVAQLDVNGNLINKYESIRCAHRETGIDCQCISFCCQDKYEKAGGFIWMYEYIYNQNINNIILYIQERKERICQTRLVLSAT